MAPHKFEKSGNPVPGTAAWFCVRTLPKHEHIAAAQLRQNREIQVFLPRIRFQRQTRRGQAWVTEALFLNYLFARFELGSHLRWIQAARGVRNVLHFGSRWPTIPESIIADLISAFGVDEIKTLSQDLQPGDAVEIVDSSFRGLQAVVTRVMPGRQRVAVLLDFLGRQTSIELARSQLTGNREVRTQPELGELRAARKAKDPG